MWRLFGTEDIEAPSLGEQAESVTNMGNDGGRRAKRSDAGIFGTYVTAVVRATRVALLVVVLQFFFIESTYIDGRNADSPSSLTYWVGKVRRHFFCHVDVSEPPLSSIESHVTLGHYSTRPPKEYRCRQRSR
ncbi:hypothetical protein KQX54_002782 [Cotesia glomerata]|uniref:Uncharacterized protein n=1 Tax=Cotesia glomerata TaxID=32391 RepID=A0AAV7J1B3_COTGL|nr:hypothetical protein KQX54_002782 [Cotesia glomerata]